MTKAGERRRPRSSGAHRQYCRHPKAITGGTEPQYSLAPNPPNTQLHRAAIMIRDEYDGTVPRDITTLLTLPGIGDYTARAVAVFGYGDDHPVVDTNTRRVLARAVQGLAQPAPPSRHDLVRMEAFLDEDRAHSPLLNAATMELGATVCVSRTPACGRCPLTATCAWRASGYPDTGDARRRQARYEGSDRQARGAVLRMLRAADPAPVALDAILIEWPDAVQRDRAIHSLIADGLAEASDGALRLPR